MLLDVKHLGGALELIIKLIITENTVYIPPNERSMFRKISEAVRNDVLISS